MKAIDKQRGLSSVGWLVVLGVIGFFLMLLFKLGPHYLSNSNVRATLKQVAVAHPLFHDMDAREIRSVLSSSLTINSVHGHSPKDFKVIKNSGKTLINHEYKRIIPMFANVEVVLTFRNQLNSENIEDCCEFLVEDEKKPKKP